MNKRDYTEFGDCSDAKTFLAERSKTISDCNSKISECYHEVGQRLLLLPENDRIILCCHTPLKALVFHDEKDRKGKINGTFVNFGEYHIETVEVWYFEFFNSNRITSGYTKLLLSGKQPDKVCEDFCIINDFGGFDDEKLSWGRNCFFLNEDEYLLFKETIHGLMEELGITQEP
jgi:hypothetical protein